MGLKSKLPLFLKEIVVASWEVPSENNCSTRFSVRPPTLCDAFLLFCTTSATADNWLATRGGRRCLPPCYPAQAPEVCTNCTNYRLGLISRYFVPTPMAKRGGRRCLPPCSHAHAPEVCTNCTHYRLSSHTKLIILDVMQLNSIQAHNTRLRFDTRLAVLRCNPRPRF